MKYCSQCGQTVTERIPHGDNRPRFICDHCDIVHYQNPRIVAGCLPIYENKILLCRRAIEPRYGFWTLPAGFMENGETTVEAALRETWEEALANVESEGLYTVIHVAHINQVHMFYLSRLIDLNFSAGEESLEVELFTQEQIPWDNIAFPTVRKTLQFYFSDQVNNAFPVRVADIESQKNKYK